MSMYFINTSEEEEVVPERIIENDDSDEIDETEGNLLLRVQKVKKELQACAKERKEYLEGWQRAKADYLNSKKRHDEERAETVTRAEMRMIEKILPLCDSFDMAFAHTDTKEEGTVWKTGFSQIHAQLMSILSDFRVTEIVALGEKFDPYKHEALSSITVDAQVKNDTVVSVLQKGYVRGDTLVRPAKVIIGVFTE